MYIRKKKGFRKVHCKDCGTDIIYLTERKDNKYFCGDCLVKKMVKARDSIPVNIE